MVISAPGWFLAILIWGYNSPESALSNAVIVITNTAVYTAILMLVYRLKKAVGRWASRAPSRAVSSWRKIAIALRMPRQGF
jgi:hypothetical protein